jgi:hypothetical protein
LTIYAAAIDPFSYIVIGLLVAGLVGILLAARLHPGSGADVLDWKPTRSPEVEAQNELDDVDQMLAAQNELRRKRGLPERSGDELADEVRREQRELDERAAAYRAEHEPPPGEAWRGS